MVDAVSVFITLDPGFRGIIFVGMGSHIQFCFTAYVTRVWTFKVDNIINTKGNIFNRRRVAGESI
ncbi:hypothetical protein D3C80_1836820 [compost metagenome]